MFGILGIEAHDSVRYSESIQNQGDFMKILLSILMISCASTALASMNCETANTKILYYCEGEDLVISRTNEPYRPGIPFNVSVCEDANNNLVMEVFPSGVEDGAGVEGALLGLVVGRLVGALVGQSVGTLVGPLVGVSVGVRLG